MSEAKKEWQLRCPKCGMAKLIGEIGGMRYGAASRGKRTLIWCTECGRYRCAIVEKVRISVESENRAQV